MPAQIAWSQQIDTAVHTLRARGASWRAIAVRLGISRSTARMRGRAIGARLQLPVHARIAPQRRTQHAPLRAGHPISWDAITAGTQFAGTAYPNLPLDSKEYRQ
jgi:hypothetical protein